MTTLGPPPEYQAKGRPPGRVQEGLYEEVNGRPLAVGREAEKPYQRIAAKRAILCSARFWDFCLAIDTTGAFTASGP